MRFLTTAIAISTVLASTHLAAAESDGYRRPINIEAQSLRPALQALSAERNVQVVFLTETVGDLKTAGARGELTTDEALAQVLAGTGLTYRYVDARTITIVPVSSASSESTDTLGSIRPTAATSSFEHDGFRLAQADSSATRATAESDRADPMNEITITGSRLARRAFDMPTPITVLNSEQIEQSGLNNIGDILERMPQIGVGFGSSTSQFSDDAGAEFVNLRSLGSARTLVLINGRRRVSGASDSAAVDLSAIPTGMIDRVELITGGASAVYGADAVSGVVNVILKKDFSGVELSAHRGIAEHGGAASTAATLFGGNTFGQERGSFSFGLSYVRDGSLFARDRSFSDHWLNFIVNPQNTGPADGIPDLITEDNFAIAFLHPAGVFNVGGTNYTVGPQLRAVRADPQSGIAIDGDGWDFSQYFQTRVRNEVTALRANLDYDINDRVALIVESEFSHGKAFGGGAPNYDFGTFLFRENPYIPADVGALMDANGLNELAVTRASVDQGLRNDHNTRNSFSILTGLEGAFGENWKWQAFAQYGRYELTSRETNQRIISRYGEAVDVITDPASGDPVCRSVAARAAGCEPLNILGRTVASEEARAYFEVDRTLRVDNTQKLVGAHLTGNLFHLPAGPVASAFGVEYRKDTRAYKDDPLAELGLLEQKTPGTSLTGKDDVSEAFMELVAPLLRDKPFVRELQLEGALRLSDYDSIGRTTAWKLGGTWAPVASMKLRATRSRSVRAPNLYELYAPRSLLRINDYDPCQASQINGGGANRAANCRALGVPEGWLGPQNSDQFYNFDTVSGGNPGLDPETSEAWTAGMVFTPESLRGLAVAVDYWKIKIEDAVSNFGYGYIVDRCVDASTIDNPFCARVTRGADSRILLIESSLINISKLSTDGVDLQAAYSFNPGWRGLAGHFYASLNATYLRSLDYLNDSTDPLSLVSDANQPRTPKWRGTLSIGYAGTLSANLNTRYISRSRLDVNDTLETFDTPRAATRIYNDLSLGYSLGRLDLRVAVNNLFDVKPPATAFTFMGQDLHDPIGRYFVIGASAGF